MNSRVALITFLDDSGNRPDNTLPGVPGYPTHPIAPGGLPPHVWPRPPQGPVDPGYGVGAPVDPGWGVGLPPHVSGGPIYPGGYPTPGPIFPPVGPDNTLPPTAPPPQVSLPIVLPEGGTKPVEPDQKFELKYSFRFGWVIVPVDLETAEPK